MGSKPESDTEIINSNRDAWASTYNAGDMEPFLGFLAPDAVWLGVPETRIGREAIGDWYRPTFETSTNVYTLYSDEIVVSGDWAFDRGRWTNVRTPKSGDQSAELRTSARYLTIWQRQPDGSWKIARNLWLMDREPS